MTTVKTYLLVVGGHDHIVANLGHPLLRGQCLYPVLEVSRPHIPSWEPVRRQYLLPGAALSSVFGAYATSPADFHAAALLDYLAR